LVYNFSSGYLNWDAGGTGNTLGAGGGTIAFLGTGAAMNAFGASSIEIIAG
jgi:hypothetical protein